jgi:hypothetical protein
MVVKAAREVGDCYCELKIRIWEHFELFQFLVLLICTIGTLFQTSQ